MQYIRLGDIASIAAGQGAPQGAENYSEYGTPFVKAGNLAELTSGTSEDAIQKVSDEVAAKHKLKLFPQGTVLFAKSGMSCMKGYVYTLSRDCYVVSHLACITPHTVESEYLKYYFEFHRPNQLVKDAAYPSISLSDIAELPIAVFDQEKRQEIIHNLDVVSGLIEKKQQILSLMDLAVKFRFIELFGDKGYPEDTLLNLCNIIDYRGKTPEKVEHGLPFITAKNVRMHQLNLEPREYISKETYDKVMVRGFPKEGDVVFTTEAPLGNVCRIPHFDTEFYIGQRIVTMQTEKLEPIYLEYALSSDDFKAKYMEKSSGSTVTGIRVRLLEQLTIPVPPMELQNQFTTFVEQTDKSKLAVQKGLEELEILKKSLMQKYFG